ncbi:MAG: putative membrane protein YhhN [Paraglaciecola sp.]|jgi:uncharacterized membrane protein YhhN
MPRNISLLYWGLASSYLLVLFFTPYPLSFIHKALPIVLLLVVAAHQMRGTSRVLLVSALFFSAGGDMLLALDFKQSFIFGLAAFALAHLSFTWCFYRWRQWHKPQLLLLLPVVLYFFVMLWLIIPASGALQIPVLGYLGIISAMAITAIMANTPNRYLLIGASSFVISDSFLAINKFLQPLPYAGWLIMFSYYLAQYYLLQGCINKGHDDEIT